MSKPVSDKGSVSIVMIRNATSDDIAAVSDLHQLVLPDFFLPHMGGRFLELFYAFFLENDNSYLLVAEDEGRIIGFTAGAADTTQHFGAFYRHKLFQIVSIVGLRFFRDATVRRGMVKRLDHLRLALSSFVRRESQSSRIQEDGDHTLAQLLFIAVHPHYRRKGIAKRLIDDCLNEFKRNGTHRIGATVLPDNASSIAFFKKNSWVIEDTTPEFVYFQRDIA